MAIRRNLATMLVFVADGVGPLQHS